VVAIKTGSVFNGSTMDVVVPNYYQKFEETYGMSMYAVHRVDLHNQLRELATQKEGLGFPVDVQVRSKVVDYVSTSYNCLSWFQSC
jgi:salicylate hydroxylase